MSVSTLASKQRAKIAAATASSSLLAALWLDRRSNVHEEEERMAAGGRCLDENNDDDEPSVLTTSPPSWTTKISLTEQVDARAAVLQWWRNFDEARRRGIILDPSSVLLPSSSSKTAATAMAMKELQQPKIIEDYRRWASVALGVVGGGNIVSGGNRVSCQAAAAAEAPPSKTGWYPAFLSFRRRSDAVSSSSKSSSGTSKKPISARYDIDPTPIGEGAFGCVYLATDKATGEKVAVKKMTKEITSDSSFRREMKGMQRIKQFGGHPHICALKETFDDDDGHYYLVMEYIGGGEMFEHLIENGAFSEFDAARLMREVASALVFLHGVGVVHADLKPENVMLSTKRSLDSVVKLVDFGSAEILASESDGVDEEDDDSDDRSLTPAFSPPEVLDAEGKESPLPERDMWALGIILYIMLVGAHPYDLASKATDEELEQRIRSRLPPPTKKRLTGHLSKSAIDVIMRLLDPNPETRLTAHEMLDHPWVRGKTAKKDKMEDSAKKLSQFGKHKSKLETQVFSQFVDWADNSEVEKKTSMIERAFQSFDVEKKGYLTAADVSGEAEQQDDSDASLSLSGFSDLLADSMQNKYFPKGHVIYDEGDIGNHMYFINAGSIEVFTKDGSKSTRSQGDFFGEGALLHAKKTRSASIRCTTPVHAIEISREYFEKYLKSEDGLKVNMREKDKTRKRSRAKTLLRLQGNLREINFRKGRALFKKGEVGEVLYIIEEGHVDVHVDGKVVFTARPGDICGEHSLVTGRKRNCTAVCASKNCKVYEMKAPDFFALVDSSPATRESLREICLRREFKKALCKKTGKSFPSAEDVKEAFDAADHGGKGHITMDEVRELLHDLDPAMEEDEIREVAKSLDLADRGIVSFQEFKRVFGVEG